MESENRILLIMSLELTSKILKLEQQLETAVNSDLDVNVKVKLITDLLGQLVLTEKSLEKFTMMTTKSDDTNKK